MERWLLDHFPAYRENSDSRQAAKDFCLLCAVFEGLLFDGRWSVNQCRDFMGQINFGGLYGSHFKAAREYFAHRYFEGSEHRIHWDLLGVPIANRDYVERCLRASDITLPDEAAALLVVAWRLRTNLLHADEWQRGHIEPAESFRHAGQVMQKILEAARSGRSTSIHNVAHGVR